MIGFFSVTWLSAGSADVAAIERRRLQGHCLKHPRKNSPAPKSVKNRIQNLSRIIELETLTLTLTLTLILTLTLTLILSEE